MILEGGFGPPPPLSPPPGSPPPEHANISRKTNKIFDILIKG